MEAKQREATEYPGFEFRTYSQTLDHFNYGPESFTTFPQRYAINFKYWGGANSTSPIFFFLGDWCNVERHVELFGFLEENAPSFRALLVFAEHRYYGESYPFGSKELAYTNSSTLKYFSSEQALADYAQLLRDLKANLSAVNSPVIAFGADYSGMLASWFRLKYPHMVIGALASSAPILYFDNITPQNGYCSVTTEDFRNIKRVLQKFGSNIIFSNGLRDPFSIGGVLQNISDTIVALTTTKGSDCLDLFESNSKDPDWLVAQRKAEVDIMKRWIEEYRMIPKE
ncbi:hypothetical protein HPP92_012458 [Vanilla planifolia]|nr:hypothetical protein HPP92_012458 [Vanilla planifolia]